MPRYRYKARKLDGGAVHASAEAANDDELERDLARRGLTLISSARDAPLQGPRPRWRQSRVRLKTQELVFLTIEFGTSYTAGLPILTTIADLAAFSDSKAVRRVCRGIRDRVHAGATLSEALGAYPRAFPSLYVESFAIAEKTGKLGKVLDDLVRNLEWERDLRWQLRSASIYPLVLLLAVLFLVFVMVVWFEPRFLLMVAPNDCVRSGMPWSARAMLWLYRVGEGRGAEVLGLVAGVVLACILVRRLTAVRRVLDLIELRVPLLGRLAVQASMARFTHHLSLLLASGIDYGSALQMCARLTDNLVLSRVLSHARIKVEEGRALSDVLARNDLIPPLVVRLIKMGERTGQMERALDEVERFYAKEIPGTVKDIIVLVHPIALTFLACVIMFMASTLVIPMYVMTINSSGHR